jgi:signal transduction histidine kinase
VGSVLRRVWTDLALVGLLVILELAGFGQDPGIGAASMALELAPILALLVRRVAPQVVAVTYLLANGASALLDLHAVNSASIVVTIVIGVYSAGAYLPLVWSLPTLGLWAVSVGIDFVAGRETGPTDLIFAWIILACAFAPGVVARRLRGQASEVRQMALRAAAVERAEAAEAVADERARIARELHDVVAHALSIMVVQTAAAEQLLDSNPERARAALAAVQQAGRTAIAEMARMLDLLRGVATDELAPLPTLDGLPDLIEDARLAGAEVVLEREHLRPLPAALELCAYRVVQEALTNTAKHAQSPRVQVRLSCADYALTVLVEDDGGTGPRASSGTRRGLLGLRERVEVFGGSLDTGPAPGAGFRVRAVLPLGAAP